MVKDKGDIDFIIDTLKENDLPLCNDYEDIKNCMLSEPLYPRDVILAAKPDVSLDVKEQCLKAALSFGQRFTQPQG